MRNYDSRDAPALFSAATTTPYTPLSPPRRNIEDIDRPMPRSAPVTISLMLGYFSPTGEPRAKKAVLTAFFHARNTMILPSADEAISKER